jgi:NADH-quinone oxidoreductase subunit N
MNALLVLCGLGIISLVAEIANFKKWLTGVIFLGLIAAAWLVVMDWNTSASYFHYMVVFDNFSLAFTGLITVISLLWFWLASDYFKLQFHKTDRTALVLFAIVGGVLMTCFNNMAMLFLGIEILSVSLYVLAGSRKESLTSNEAAFKYFLMGSFATGFLLLGIAFVYGATGSFQINTIADYALQHAGELPSFFYAGALLMLIGLAFKISAVPFHFWAPDVYEGSPTSITAFMSTVVKIAAIAAFHRIFSVCFTTIQPVWILALQAIMVLTLVLPNVTAVYQSSLKRMLAYSSVGHVGYILLAFIADDQASAGPIFYYLASYAIASLAAFGVLIAVQGQDENSSFDKFNGLFKRNPLLAVGMTLSMLSLAGIPPLPGFFGKYMVFALAIANGQVGFVILAVVTSLIGVYYYFRVLIAMYFKEPAGGVVNVSSSVKIFVLVLIVLTLLLGIFPDQLVLLLSH